MTNILPLFILILIVSLIECISGFGIGASSFSSLSDRKKINAHHVHNKNDLQHKDNAIQTVSADSPKPKSNYSSRRIFLSQLTTSSSIIIGGSSSLYPTQNANALALPFFGGQEKRQLELCLTTVLRTEYWAMTVAKSIQSRLLSSSSDNATNNNNKGIDDLSEDQKKLPYLEARLGAKALLTQKIGGGANSKVELLGTFQLKECLDDLKYWCGELAKNNQLPKQLSGDISSSSSNKNAKRIICGRDLENAIDELVESLASLVEFDGLETTIDPSPRSSLMLSMYDARKGQFVYRTLMERVIPSCEQILKIFGSERITVVEEFVRREVPQEVPFEVLERLYDNNHQN